MKEKEALLKESTVTTEFAVLCGLALHERLSNAIKHAFPPECYEVEGFHPGISLRSRARDDGCHEIDVTDNGVGIPSETEYRSKRIEVVGDEGIMALDLQDCLMKLGYSVAELASSGGEAVWGALRVKPDLLLMDIRLGNGIDGVEAAVLKKESMDIPIIYLSAYTDDETLSRAKRTQPFGYIVKPFWEYELRKTIEMALFKHTMERRLVEREQWLSTPLRSIGDGVIATQADGKILFMNPMAKKLTAQTEHEAMGRDFSSIFKIVSPEGSESTPDPCRTL